MSLEDDVSELTDAEKADVADRMVRELRVEQQVTRVLVAHRPREWGVIAWLCACGYEGNDLPEDHMARKLADAGLLAPTLPETSVSQPNKLD